MVERSTKEEEVSQGGRGSASLSSKVKKPSNEEVLNVAFFSFVGFLLVQAVFALIANSQSMLADCEAMSVDAITYLFNLCAERIKNRPYNEAELSMTKGGREYHRERQRLYLEMIPPGISVLALIAITCNALIEACATFYRYGGGEEVDVEDDVSVPIMFFFSGANLVLDVVNVTCFARADMTFSVDILRQERSLIRDTIKGGCHPHVDTFNDDFDGGSSREDVRLLVAPTTTTPMQFSSATTPTGYGGVAAGLLDRSSPPESLMVNLNMCSAWTHVCADTLRSSAVLLASALATAVPSVNGTIADAAAAIVVSAIILVSLIPLIQGIILTGIRIITLESNRPP